MMKRENQYSEANISNECNIKSLNTNQNNLNTPENNFNIVLNVKDGKINNYQIKKLAKILKYYEIKKIDNKRRKLNWNNAENNILENLKTVNSVNEGKILFS